MRFRIDLVAPDKKRTDGFTLIELLVVIAIIALLLSILMPALSRVKGSAREILCAANLKGTGLGLVLYTQNHGGVLPPASDPGRPSEYIPYWWQTLLHKELISSSQEDWYQNIDDPKSETIWRCPEKKPHVEGARIGYNEHLNEFVSGRPIKGRKVLTIRQPAKMIAIGDSERDLFSFADWAPPIHVMNTRTPEMGLCMYSFAYSRHGGRKPDTKEANMLFVDGHLQTMRTIEYSNPTDIPGSRKMWVPDER